MYFGSAPRPPSYFSSVPHRRRALDLTALGALFVLAALGFHHVYGGIQYLLTAVMALVLGTLTDHRERTGSTQAVTRPVDAPAPRLARV